MALPEIRRRGPGFDPLFYRVADRVSADPAPSVPMSRSAVNPAIRSSLAASTASTVRCGTDSSTLCKSSRLGEGRDAREHQSSPATASIPEIN